MSLLTKRRDVYYDDMEEMTDRSRRLYLDRKLQQAIGNAYKHAPSAREIMERARTKPSDIQNVKSLVRLPVTRKAELMELQKSRPPYGGFLAVKPENVERVFVSPGPVYVPFFSSKIKWFARSLWAAGFGKGDTVINTFDQNLSAIGIPVNEGLRHCGAAAVPAGTFGLETQLQMLRDLKVNGYAGTPSALMALIQKAEASGNDFGKDYGLKRAWFTGEILTAVIRETL
jgi:phenylacetate-CoA ligase